MANTARDPLDPTSARIVELEEFSDRLAASSSALVSPHPQTSNSRIPSNEKSETIDHGVSPHGWQPIVARIRDMVMQFKSSTKIRTSSKRERFEVETIQKTLNVILAELDAIVAMQIMNEAQPAGLPLPPPPGVQP